VVMQNGKLTALGSDCLVLILVDIMRRLKLDPHPTTWSHVRSLLRRLNENR